MKFSARVSQVESTISKNSWNKTLGEFLEDFRWSFLVIANKMLVRFLKKVSDRILFEFSKKSWKIIDVILIEIQK